MKSKRRIEDEVIILKDVVKETEENIEKYGWNFFTEELKTFYIEKRARLNALRWVLEDWNDN